MGYTTKIQPIPSNMRTVSVSLWHGSTVPQQNANSVHIWSIIDIILKAMGDCSSTIMVPEHLYIGFRIFSEPYAES